MAVAGGGGHDLITVSPVLEAAGGLRVAPVRLVNMLNAGGAILEAAFQEEERDGRPRAVLSLRVRGRGELLVHASSPPVAVVVAGEARPWSWDEAQRAARFDVEDVGGVLEAWVQVAF